MLVLGRALGDTVDGGAGSTDLGLWADEEACGSDDAELKSSWTSAEEGLRVGGGARREGKELSEVELPFAFIRDARNDAVSLLDTLCIGLDMVSRW